MAFSLYDGTITTAKSALISLKGIISKAEQHENASSFLSARLTDDMKPFSFQVHFSTSQTDKMVAILTGDEPSGWKDDLVSYAELNNRIDHVLKSLDEADKNTINKYGEEIVSERAVPQKGLQLHGKTMATAVLIPNILFHISMAYAILRKEGVQLGKADYLHGFLRDYF